VKIKKVSFIIIPMEYKRITLRIPQTLHKILLNLSSEKSKSMNFEIINRLKNSLTVDNE